MRRGTSDIIRNTKGITILFLCLDRGTFLWLNPLVATTTSGFFLCRLAIRYLLPPRYRGAHQVSRRRREVPAQALRVVPVIRVWSAFVSSPPSCLAFRVSSFIKGKCYV